MSQRIPESELILNASGAVYHLNLFPEDIADTVIIVGDPGRVAKVSKYFDRIELRKRNREFVTHTGTLAGKRLTVISTGMGTDNIDIFMTELDALVNVDLKKRSVKRKLKKLNVVRFGTSGALQKDISLNSIVVSSHGIGLDNVLQYYQRRSSATDRITKAFIRHLGKDAKNLAPYVAAGSKSLINKFKKGCLTGMTATGSGFFGPQGRIVRLPLAKPSLIDKLASFNYEGLRITNFEMETSAIYGIGTELLGHNCCSLSLIIANRATQTYSKAAASNMQRMIQLGLEQLLI